MANGGSHFADLPVAAFGKGEFEPDVRDIFPITDGWIARREFRLWIENPGATGACFPVFDDDAFLQHSKRRGSGNALHEGPVGAFVGVERVEQPGIHRRFVRKQQQTFTVCIQAAQGIHIGREIELCQRPVGTAIRGKLREDAVGFVKGKKHVLDTSP